LVTSHTDPAGLVAQSALVAQRTHRPLVVSQAGPKMLPAQSALAAQAFTHPPPTGPCAEQT
jgi:hypothetical protein